VTTALAAAPVADGERALGDREFARLRDLIRREAGISLGAGKRALLVGRLSRRLRELGLGGFREYCDRVEAEPAEIVAMLDCVSTNETHFFREPHHFQFLADKAYPRWKAEAAAGIRPRRIRAWSAACSTGEEPYTIAMSLLRSFPPGSGWALEVLATDLSTRVLAQARAASWPIDKRREIPQTELRAYMLRGVGPLEGTMRAGPEIRALVEFRRLNLVEETYAGVGEFDLLFCRNVLIYFDAPTKERVVGHLLRHLRPGGHLFLGHAESLTPGLAGLQSVEPSVYARREPRSRGEG
jgi:chemotaxis protein methyltransferase CheR